METNGWRNNTALLLNQSLVASCKRHHFCLVRGAVIYAYHTNEPWYLGFNANKYGQLEGDLREFRIPEIPNFDRCTVKV